MMRKLVLMFCVVLATVATASAGSISFTGSGTSGTIDPGQPFTYDFDNAGFEPDWGVPGVNGGLATWNGPTVNGFTISFDLPGGVSIDPMNLGTTCDGTASGGTVFCAGPFGQPWDVEALTANSITFQAPDGELLTNGDPFFINIFFTGGDPAGVSFNGEWLTSPVPEPNSLLFLGSGVLGFMAVLRKYMQ